MVHREPQEVLPTMKVNEKKLKEGDILAKETQVEIVSVKDIETDNYGKKTVAVVQNDDNGKFQIFVNNFSMHKLCEGFGNDDEAWKGKLCDVKIEEDPQFGNEMLVLYPVA